MKTAVICGVSIAVIVGIVVTVRFANSLKYLDFEEF